MIFWRKVVKQNSEQNIRILLVDDEQEIRNLVRSYLEAEGYSITTAADGREALELFRQDSYSLVILDVMMEHKDGFAVCANLRQTSACPIMMLTARDAEYDRVKGLNLGADDYVTKPFSVYELIARVKALLRRHLVYAAENKTGDREHWQRQDLFIDPVASSVFRGGELIPLTATEARILICLAANPGQVYTKKQLAEAVWEGEYTDPNTVMVHIRRLRKKLEKDPGMPEYIQTVWGIGYRFRV